MFSATWPQSVHRLARGYCGERPIHINIGAPENVLRANLNIVQEFFFLEGEPSFEGKMKRSLALIQQELEDPKSKVLLFAGTKVEVDRITGALKRKGVKAAGFHGNKSQTERNGLLQEFRQGEFQILVATDVAQRGLDIENIECVVNFSLPTNIEGYVHRIGRTGRAGHKGRSYSFFCAKDIMLAPELMKLLTDAG